MFITSVHAIHFIVLTYPVSTSVDFDSLPGKTTKTFIHKVSGPFLFVLPWLLGCSTFSLTLISVHESTKRLTRGCA